MVYESELYHHGILGQKWGKRNGPPYPLNGSSKSSSKKSGSSKEEGKAVNRITNETSNIINASKDVVRTAKKISQKNEDSSKMTDQELRNAVNRLNLEQQYNNLKKSQKKSGLDYVDTVLSYAGDLAKIGGSVASIIMAITKLKGK